MASHTSCSGSVPTTPTAASPPPVAMKPPALSVVDEDDAIDEDDELDDDDDSMASSDSSSPTQSSNNVSVVDSNAPTTGSAAGSDVGSASGAGNSSDTSSNLSDNGSLSSGSGPALTNGNVTMNGNANDNDDSNMVSLNSPSKVPLHLPLLVRRTFIHPQCYYDHPDLQVEPVKLKFSDDPAILTENWTPEEIAASRRIVKFHFTPNEVNIGGQTQMEYHVGFEAITPDEYDHVSPIVSCIWWQEMNLHIVTSVDIIVLLEHMVRQQFSIEEKNRIRRNLQSLKPYTVARTNHRFLPFFNLIMEMEDPRPRNIEKDIKVFRWADLSLALEKVLFKYTWNVPRFQFYLVRKENQFGQLPSPPPPKHQPDEFVSADRVRRMRRHWQKGAGTHHHLHSKGKPDVMSSVSAGSSSSLSGAPPPGAPGHSSFDDDTDNSGKKSGETTVSNSTSSDEDMTNGVGSVSSLSSGGYATSVFSGSSSSADSEVTSASDGSVMASRKSPDKHAPGATAGFDSAPPIQPRYPLHYYQFPAGSQLRYDTKAPVVPSPEVPAPTAGASGATVLPASSLGPTTLPPISSIHLGAASPPAVLLPPLRDTSRPYPPPPALPSIMLVNPASPKPLPRTSPAPSHQFPGNGVS